MMWNTQQRLFQLIKERQALVSLSALFLLLAATFGAAIMHNRTPALARASYVALPGSFTAVPGDAHEIGSYTGTAPLTVSIVLRPTNVAGLRSLLAELYDPVSLQYHKWLTKGQFNALFAPSKAEIEQVTHFLQLAGLTISRTSSPFILRASGTVTRMQAAFHTKIDSYKAVNGRVFFQNVSAMQIPANLAQKVVSVVGLASTVRMHPNYISTLSVARRKGTAAPRYGAGPGGSGLTPAQVAGLYDANAVYALGSRGRGSDSTLAVFELSGYTPGDIEVYEQQFFGRSEYVPLQEIDVDGGPVHPTCPAGDECGPFTSSGPCVNGCNSADYSGDIEVEADVERQIATAPNIKSILIYNAPNDEQGLTTLDEYFKIANDDRADVISSGWGLCEQDAGSGFAQAESIPLQQLAAQGQSMFAAAGDTGAYDCLRGSGNTALAVDDPASQPFVTAVGGTSFEAFDPGNNQHPVYPANTETVWNVQNRCNGTSSGLSNCASQGAGGGGVSIFWAMSSYQLGKGIGSSYSRKGTYCGQSSSVYCREVPDVSADADEYTPYAEYCTGNSRTNSDCATFSSSLAPPGWFGIGGTSLSCPLWSGIIALWDSVHGARFGSANYGLYTLFRSHAAYRQYYHDITGQGQKENNNGYYPTTPYYDMATGIGSPDISAIAEANL